MLLGILNSQAAGGGDGAYDLLETTTLSSSASSVTFSGLGSYSDYAHLQIRYIVRTDRTNNVDGVTLKINGDTANNYSHHRLLGYGSVGSFAAANVGFIYLGLCPDASSTANTFGAGVADILDAFETTKYKTVRTLGGTAHPTDPYVSLTSGSWRDTSSLTSLTVDQTTGPNFVAGSRFSLYGIKGA
jgi:hypothetical protein